MLFVIIHHFIVDDFGLRYIITSDFARANEEKIVLLALNAVVIVGVNLFFLSSGFFSIKLKKKSLIHIVLKIYIIIWIVLLLGILTNNIVVDFGFWKFLLDPIDEYWYLAVYIFLMLFSPLLNLIVEHIDKKMFLYYISIFIFVFCIYGLLMDKNLHLQRGYSFLMASSLYIIGGGIAKFSPAIDKKKKKLLVLLWGLVTILDIVAIIFVDAFFGEKFAWLMYGYNQPLIVIQSVTLLLLFKDVTINNLRITRYICFLAHGTLTTYLLHSTCWLGVKRTVFIQYIERMLGFEAAIALLLFLALVIYAACSVVDSMFEYTWKKIMKRSKL